MKQLVLVTFLCVIVASCLANVPLACISSPPPDTSNSFPLNSAQDCTYRHPELADFFYNQTGAAAFLARVSCKPALAASDAAVAARYYAGLRYFYSVKYPLPEGVGTAYTGATCAEAAAVTAACGFSSKRQQFNAEVERRENEKRQKGGKPTTAAPTTAPACNNPNIPGACPTVYGADPFGYNATFWYPDYEIEPPNQGARFPTLYDFWANQGGAQQWAGTYFGTSDTESLRCALPSGVSSGGYMGGAMTRIAASVFRHFSCSLEGGNGASCDCAQINSWYNNVCQYSS